MMMPTRRVTARMTGIDIFTIGQYLRPSPKHAAIQKYYHPDDFKRWRDIGTGLGLRWVFSAPLVRSSYHADEFSPADEPQHQDPDLQGS